MRTFADLSVQLRQMGEAGLVRRLESAADRLADRGRDRAQALARERLTMRTWRLHNSIRGEVMDDFDSLSVQLSAGGEDLDYPRFQEEGTRHLRPTFYLRDGSRWLSDRFMDVVAEELGEALRGGLHGG